MKTGERAHMHVASATDAGSSGKNNEDRFSVSTSYLSNNHGTPSLFSIVADGIGGHLGGEVAAEITVNNISEHILESDAANPTEILKRAIIATSERIRQQADAENIQRGMGSTCVCLWIIGNQCYLANVGDSRIYIIRNKEIYQLTIDHTWVQEAIEHGIITTEQAVGHPRAHVIRRYLGSSSPVVPDLRINWESDNQQPVTQGLIIYPDDIFIQCTDGLTDLVSDGEILDHFLNNEMQAAVDLLIALANQRGGHDNITVVSLKYPGNEDRSKPDDVATQKNGNSSVTRTCAFLMILLGLTLACIWMILAFVLDFIPFY